MAISFIEAVTTLSGSSSGSQSADRPSTITNNDVLIAHVHSRDGTHPDITCTGWSSIIPMITGAGASVWLGKRITDAASEPTSYTFNLNGVASHTVISIMRFTGVIQSGQFWEGAASFSDVNTDMSFDTPAVTTLGANRMIVRGVGLNQTGVGTTRAWESPVEEMYFASTGSNPRTGTGGREDAPSAGTYEIRTLTNTAVNSNAVTGALALIPQITDTTPPSAPSGLIATPL